MTPAERDAERRTEYINREDAFRIREEWRAAWRNRALARKNALRAANLIESTRIEQVITDYQSQEHTS